MYQHTVKLITALLFALSSCVYQSPDLDNQTSAEDESDKLVPSELFFIQRSYPDTIFPLKAYTSAIKEASQKRKLARSQSRRLADWKQEGPGNIGGRVNCIAVHPSNTDIVYIGSASGGIFKSVDDGANWVPIFDDQPFLAIGHIAIDPNHPDTIYAGTGDVNISGYPFIGDGIYRSYDAGQSWSHIGLEQESIISKIFVHPQNSQLIYASAMGLPFVRSNKRGLYKSIDGGNSWTQVLYLSNETGVIDFLCHPTDSNTIYAAGWDRIRTNKESLVRGNRARIHKSTDGGANWTLLSNGLPQDTLSRIGLVMHPSNYDVIYAEIIGQDLELEGIYKTVNGGSSWTVIPTAGISGSMSGFGWYFGQIRLNPFNPNDIYILGVDLWRSSNEGVSWEEASPPWWSYDVHADKHDLVFTGNTSMILATDGGLYKSTDDAVSWVDYENIPINQFYHVTASPHQAFEYWGGLQDNGTTAGSASNFNSWPRIYGGDGFHVELHPSDPNIIYVETQWGGLSVSNNGGSSFNNATNGIDGNDRVNWDMPYILSYHNPDLLYAGTHRLYKDQRVGTAVQFNAISPDLTDGVIYGERFHTISTIRESRFHAGVLFVGTSDGNLWKSIDDGGNWIIISDSLPDRYFTDIETSSMDSSTLFVTNSGYKDNDFLPHIHISKDLGISWQDISGDLPALAINDMEVSNDNDSILFVATDGGVFFTLNCGIHWELLGTTMPTVAVYDIEIDYIAARLIAGTFGRSMYSISLDSLVEAEPVVAEAGEMQSICKGETAVLSSSSIGNLSWEPSSLLSCNTCNSPIASPDTTTIFTLIVDNGAGLSDTDYVRIVVLPNPPVPGVFHETDSLWTSAEADKYRWYRNNQALANSDSPYYIFQKNGSYQVEITDSNQCTSISDTINIFVDGISQIDQSLISVYPNPASSFIWINAPGSDPISNVHLYNLSGELFYESNSKESLMIPVLDLPKGIYILRIMSTDDRVWRKKVLVM